MRGDFATTRGAAQRLRRPGKLVLTALWLVVAMIVLWLLGLVAESWSDLLLVLKVLDSIVLLIVGMLLLWRIVHRNLLWGLRNRLILTYLLFGLAPVVLGVMLISVAAYIVAGQFAIHLADTRVLAELDQMSVENANRLGQITRAFAALPPLRPGEVRDWRVLLPPEPPSLALDPDRMHLQRHRRLFVDGVPVDVAVVKTLAPVAKPAAPETGTLKGAAAATPVATATENVDTAKLLGLPPWALVLPSPHTSNLVLDGHDLYLVALDQYSTKDHHTLTLLTSLKVTPAFMQIVSRGLGRTTLYAIKTNSESTSALHMSNGTQPAEENAAVAESTSTAVAPSKVAVPGKDAERVAATKQRATIKQTIDETLVAGGAIPPRLNLADINIRFLSTLSVADWDTGQNDNIPIQVESRPSLLYLQLFGGSLGGIITSAWRIALIALILLLALIEAFALYLAVRLGRTITSSVAELYAGTQSIDRGEFDHRIRVTSNDQLADLSRSFNSMTASIERLLIEQQEKERLQNEISIAQEVQANLFPNSDLDLPSLQLHGICRPARSVSGDYYDFLVFHQEQGAATSSRIPSRVGIALGDISGKGISAALLMATLHSAVRAYRFASEAIVYSSSTLDALTSSRDGLGEDSGKLFASPGRILSLLNRHLYRSTQPEKYATLFLAHYDVESQWLTYSNAGQLPPFVLSRDGSLRRLEVGGTVVGLMDGMHYAEEGFEMMSGDILIAYSDGVTEPENDFGDFGEERLIEVVQRYRDEPLEVISSQVMQALDAWIGAEEQPDDITLVLARQK